MERTAGHGHDCVHVLPRSSGQGAACRCVCVYESVCVCLCLDSRWETLRAAPAYPHAQCRTCANADARWETLRTCVCVCVWACAQAVDVKAAPAVHSLSILMSNSIDEGRSEW
eukprot:7987323-Alexandrium_andersonii.AAC.1